MPDAYTPSNLNLHATTREAILKGIKKQVLLKMPLYARLIDAKQQMIRGGTVIRRPVNKASLAGNGQFYANNDDLTVASKTFLDNPYFHWKNYQFPITYGIEEEFDNDGPYAGEDLKAALIEASWAGCKEELYRMMYGADSAGTNITTTDDGVYFQSIRQALTHDHTYGHVTSTIATPLNTWWQGGSITGLYTDLATSRTASIANVRALWDAVGATTSYGPSDYLFICGPAIFRKLQAECESRRMFTSETPLVKYGFETLNIDRIEVVNDYYLTNAKIANSHLWVFLLCIPEWFLPIHPKRKWKMIPFGWQGDKPNGKDQWLARIMLRGNGPVTFKPNASIHNSNWS